MKRAGNLIENVADRENLLLAFWKAQKGKRAVPEVVAFRHRLEGECARLREQLLSGTYLPGAYRSFRVFDPKERVICAAPFRDRVVHHALMNVCHECFEKYQIWDSYACRIDKGTHRAVQRAQHFARSAGYYLKLDIRKYFDSIDHAVLKGLLARRFKDSRVLDCFHRIIESHESSPGRGIPIGNLTSQYFANHYLAVLDHHVKEHLGVRAYLRYMDDFVLWHDDRACLRDWRERVTDFLAGTLRLEMKPDCLNRVDRGMTFLGYRVYPDRVTLARRSRVRFRRKLNAADQRVVSGEWDEAEAARHVEPLLAFVRHAQCDQMRRRLQDHAIV